MYIREGLSTYNKDEWDNLQTACQDAVGNNDFRGFCSGMWYNIGVVWKRQTVSSGSLLENVKLKFIQ